MAFPSPFHRCRRYPWRGLSAGEDAPQRPIVLLDADPAWVYVQGISDLRATPVSYVECCFPSHESVPCEPGTVSIPKTCGARRAQDVMRAARQDYGETLGGC